jgi:hypothetical protein
LGDSFSSSNKLESPKGCALPCLKTREIMTELQIARGATKWLRSFGLAAVGLLLAGVMAITSFLSAQSAADGSDSEIDYAVSLSATSSATLLGATYSSLPQPTGANPYSVQLWVNPGPVVSSTQVSDRVLINMEHKFAIIAQNGVWKYYTGNGTAWAGGLTNTNIPVRQGQWVHVGLVLTSMGSWSTLEAAVRTPVF